MFGSKIQEPHAPSYSYRFHHILSPLSPNSVNVQSSLCQPTKKRKHDDISTREEIGGPFIVKAPPSSLLKDSLKLVPKLLISRLHLPLAFLEPIKDIGGAEGTRFFSARIPVLDSQPPLNANLNEPTVLIAGSVSNSNLYAVERAGQGTYALCKLSAHVELKDLEKSDLQCCTQTKIKHYERRIIPGNEWWHSAAIEGNGALRSNQIKEENNRHLGRMQLCLKPPSLEKSATPATENVLSEISPKQAPSISDKMADEVALQPFSEDPDEIFDMIKSNYQEALYMSQVSLAYFAKGPLSRARAFFQSNVVSPPSALRLPDFLRSCVLSLPILDKKYKESLPDIINGLPAEVLTDNDCGALVETLRKKSRKSKKSKIGKNGLYPEEEISIAKWWMSRNSSLNEYELIHDKEECRDKTRILLQKAREIQLQIILILETLALESPAPAVAIKQNGLDDITKRQVDPVREQKPKKPKDLQTLLDLLMDRLCIWQSMNNEDVGIARNENGAIYRDSGRAWNQESGPNNLRDFCIDVVLPFYGARLPDLSTMLCQKLGGPKPPSPKRPLLAKAATSSQVLVRPGAALRRQPSQKSRRTLERVLTDDRIASRRPSPALSRSATDSMLPSLKREISDVSMSSIPINKVPLHKLKRYSQREVDLGAASQANEAKLKKKAGMEKELQSAIAALKRPNPRMAVKELVEAAEKRTSMSRLQKGKNPSKNQFTQSVQVMVTPSVNRHKNFFSGLPQVPQTSKVLLPELEDIPPSSGLRIIASTPTFSAKTNNRSQHFLPPVEQTPSRGPSKFSRPVSRASLSVSQNHVMGQNFITPTKPKHSLSVSSMTEDVTFSLPNKIGNTEDVDPSVSNKENLSQEVQDTPLKVRPAETSQEPPSSMDKGNPSIYEQLGWDDDVDELL